MIPEEEAEVQDHHLQSPSRPDQQVNGAETGKDWIITHIHRTAFA